MSIMLCDRCGEPRDTDLEVGGYSDDAEVWLCDGCLARDQAVPSVRLGSDGVLRPVYVCYIELRDGLCPDLMTPREINPETGSIWSTADKRYVREDIDPECYNFWDALMANAAAVMAIPPPVLTTPPPLFERVKTLSEGLEPADQTAVMRLGLRTVLPLIPEESALSVLADLEVYAQALKDARAKHAEELAAAAQESTAPYCDKVGGI